MNVIDLKYKHMIWRTFLFYSISVTLSFSGWLLNHTDSINFSERRGRRGTSLEAPLMKSCPGQSKQCLGGWIPLTCTCFKGYNPNKETGAEKALLLTLDKHHFFKTTSNLQSKSSVAPMQAVYFFKEFLLRFYYLDLII